MTERARTTAETGDRILTATTELVAERPFAQLTLAAVAERAGVTVQTVIRRFGDKDGLLAAAAARGQAAVAAQRNEAPVGDPSGIVANLVVHYESQGRVALRLLAEEEASPSLASLARAGRAFHREWCTRVFEPFLPGTTGVVRERRLAQLVAICDVYSWRLLRIDSGLSRRQTGIALLEMLEPLTTGRH